MKKIYAEPVEENLKEYNGAEYQVLVVDENAIKKEYLIGYHLYVSKADYDEDKYNLSNYKLESGGDGIKIDKEDINDYYIVHLDEIPGKVLCFLQKTINFICSYDTIEDLVQEYIEDNDLEVDNRAYVTADEVKDFINTIPKLHEIPDYYEEVTYIWDGHNMKRILLEGEYSDYIDYTDEFSGLEEIDRLKKNTGHYELLRNDKYNILCYVSYWQGDYTYTYYVMPAGVEDINDALKHLYKNHTCNVNNS